MANARGGILVLGVDDKSRQILGMPVEILQVVEEWVSELCNDSIKPPLEVITRKMELSRDDGSLGAVVCVKVPRSLFVHRSPGGYCKRIGSAKRKIASETLVRLIQDRSHSQLTGFDEFPVPGAFPRDIDSELARRFLKRNTDLSETALRKLGVVAGDEGGAARLTVGGVLLCTTEPTQYLPHARIQAVCYVGERTDLNYQADARDFTGPIDEQVMQALHFARKNMRVGAVKQLSRSERPQYSERAIFESLVNAVVHRDYSIAGSQIRFHMFRNRLELYVPDSLANTLTLDSMIYRQYSRNQFVVSLLSRCEVHEDEALRRSRMMDRRGDGLPIILNDSLDLSGRKPQYTLIDDSELRLIIWSA